MRGIYRQDGSPCRHLHTLPSCMIVAAFATGHALTPHPSRVQLTPHSSGRARFFLRAASNVPSPLADARETLCQFAFPHSPHSQFSLCKPFFCNDEGSVGPPESGIVTQKIGVCITLLWLPGTSLLASSFHLRNGISSLFSL